MNKTVKPSIICGWCAKAIARGSNVITMGTSEEVSISFHKACFDSVAKAIERKAPAPGRSRTGPASRK